jgi:hypothetical protein
MWSRLQDFPTWGDWLSQVADSTMLPGPTHSSGATRRVGPSDNPRVHEVLVAMNARNWTLSYAVAQEPQWSVPARDYLATVRLISLTDRDATVVDWSSRYDCDKAEEEHIDTLLQGLYRSFISGLSTFG